MNISLIHGTKIYNPNIYALSACDLDIKSGELLVVMGPSGSGKSTLLKVLSGIEPLTAGELYFDGVASYNIAPAQRDVSLVFQEYVLYPNKTVFENILAGVKYRGIDYDAAVQRAEEALQLLDLCPVRDQRPKALSGGQQQRTALAKALVSQSRLVLMDEPMSNVSEEARAAYCRMIAVLKQKMPDATFVYVTHNGKEALQLADRIAFMDEGRVLGTVKRSLLAGRNLPEDPKELFREPLFTGSVRLPCEIKDEKITIFDHTAMLPMSVSARLLRIPENGEAEIKIEKLSKTPLLHGIPLDMTVEENGGDWLRMSVRNTAFYLPKRTNLEPGTRIRMYCDVQDMTFFDAQGKASAWYSLGGNVFPAKMLGRKGTEKYFLPYDAISPATGEEACVIRAERCLQEEDMGDYKIGYYEVAGIPQYVAVKLGPGEQALTAVRPKLSPDVNRAIML